MTFATEDNTDATMKHRCDFYNRFLHPREGCQDTSWTIMMLARRKYFPALRQRETVLCREVLRAKHMTQARFLKVLELVEFKASAWIDHETGEGVPRRACVCYISANALNEKKAYFAQFETMFRTVKNMSMNNHEIPLPSVLSGYKSCLEQNSFREYIKLDVDTKDPKYLTILADILVLQDIKIVFEVETRGGCHLLLACGPDMKALYKLHKKVRAEFGQQDAWFTIEPPKTTAKLVVPGTWQADFMPRLKLEGEGVACFRSHMET